MMPALSAVGPQLVTTDDLPEYPFDRSDRLAGHYFMVLEFDRFLESRFADNASFEVRGVYLTLMMLAQKQRPIGTLPSDEADIAHKLRLSDKEWQCLASQPFGPLYGWQKCLCDGEVRLWHPMVLDQLQNAHSRRSKNDGVNDGNKIRQRVWRMRQALAAMGCSDAVIADAELMTRIDLWLFNNTKGPRNNDAYAAALTYAKEQRWF